MTVIAPSAELADVLAKTVFVLGGCEGEEFLDRLPDVGAFLLPRRGAGRLVGKVEVAHA